MNYVFCKQENIAITVAYYEYTMSSDFTILHVVQLMS